MTEEEILEKIKRIIEPYGLLVQLYSYDKEIKSDFDVELSGKLPDHDVVKKITLEIEKIERVDRILWLLRKKQIT